MLQPTAVHEESSMPAALNRPRHSVRVLQAPPGHWARISMANRPAQQWQGSQPAAAAATERWAPHSTWRHYWLTSSPTTCYVS